MLFDTFNLVALVCGLAVWIGLRIVWYSPLLFGRGWLGAGYEDNRDTFSLQALIVSLPFAVLPILAMAAVLMWFDRSGGEVTLITGLAVGWALWLGFAFPSYGLELIDRSRDHGETLDEHEYWLDHEGARLSPGGLRSDRRAARRFFLTGP